LVAQVFAGFVVGFALSLLVAPIAAIQIVRSNGQTGLAQRIAPPGTNMIALSMVLHFAAVIVLTAVGIVLGMLLGGLDDTRPDGGLGSPNLAFTLIVVALTAVIAIPVLALPAVRRPVVIAAVVFAVAFGWGMPWLASLG
jgi:hypothetical protein